MSRIQRIGFSVLSGILLSLAWTQWMSGLVLLLAFVPLLFVESYFYQKKTENKSSQVFFFSYLSFSIWNLLTSWWIVKATVFGVIVAVLFNSLFMAVVFVMFHISKRKFGEKIGLFLLIILWISFEYLHLNWELSWPWLTLGNGLAKNNKLIQWYEFTGALGGTFWILLSNLLIFIALNNFLKKEGFKNVKYSIILLIFILIVPISYSIVKYRNYNEKSNPVNITILQPNIDPYNEKFSRLTDDDQMEILLNLAAHHINNTTDFLVGPETAIPSTIWENQLTYTNHYKSICNLISNFPKANFVLGLSSGKVFKNGETLSETARKFKEANIYYDLYNSAVQIDSKGSIQLYHKSKLVLGVEKMPFRKALSFLESFAVDLGGTTGSLGTQKNPTIFYSKDKNHKTAPLICYESIYGEYVSKFVAAGADLIFVITNDGWWGNSPGYLQHLNMSKMRAIETRRSIARSANTGISCFINQKGDLILPTKWWTRTAIQDSINANNSITFYVKHGDYLGRICSIASLLIIVSLFVSYIIKSFRKIKNYFLPGY